MKLGLNAFTAGVVVTTIVIALVILRPSGLERSSFQLTANGADMSRHRVATLSVAERDGASLVVAQRCNGACDDLSLRMKTGRDDGIDIRAVDASGRCVRCGGAYVTSGLRVNMSIVGADELELRHNPDLGAN